MRASHFLALFIALALFGWMSSPQWWPLVAGEGAAEAKAPAVEDEAAASPRARVGDVASPALESVTVRAEGEAARALPSVRTWRSRAEATPIELRLDGRTAPSRQVHVRAEASGRVVSIAAERGALLEAGQRILALDEQDMRASLAEAEALARQRELEYEAARNLGNRGFQAETNVAGALAALRQARAQLERAQIELSRTTIAAPFAGVLDDRPVEIGDFVERGDVIGLVVEQDPFLVVGDAIEDEAVALRPGMKGRARLVDGRIVDGVLRFVAAVADPDTRTFEIELEVDNPDGRFKSGATAGMVIAVDEAEAHPLPVSVMTLSDDGRIGVKLVDGEDKIVFAAAEIARAEADRVWLTGLPSVIDVVVVGQGFVRDGQEVRPTRIEEAAELAALR